MNIIQELEKEQLRFKNAVNKTKEQLEEAQKQYPLGRYGSPEDIANLAIFLLSDASSWMTGSSIDITGGSITL